MKKGEAHMDMLEILSLMALGLVPAIILYKGLVARIVIKETHIGLVYRHGRYKSQVGPGLHHTWKPGASWEIFDLRRIFLTVPGQELLSNDNVGLRVSLSVAYEIKNAVAAAQKVESYQAALYTLVQTALRSAVGKLKIDELLDKRDDLGKTILSAAEAEADAIGIRLVAVEIKDVMFAGELKKIFAEVVKAQKEGQAALERARAESTSLRNLANAARMLENNPALMNLRLLQSLGTAASSAGNTFVLGVPAGLVPMEKKNGNVLKQHE